MLRIRQISGLVVLLAALGCGEPNEESTQRAHHISNPPEEISKIKKNEASQKKEPQKRKPCVADKELVPEKFDMFTIVELINALPKPLTIPCLIDVLPKPINLTATDSELSVQPAVGVENPRVFIESDWFIFTFALAGKGIETVEFSEIVNFDSSIKGEIAFPVTEELEKTAAMDEVARKIDDGTRCASCHFNEAELEVVDGYKIFESKALRPFNRQIIPLEDLKSLQETCGDVESLRCQILDSLFLGEDSPNEYLFPENMPTLF